MSLRPTLGVVPIKKKKKKKLEPKSNLAVFFFSSAKKLKFLAVVKIITVWLENVIV